MDYLFLPYLQSDELLAHALRRMRRTDSRAVVVEHAIDAKRLYMNKAVVDAWSDGKSACSELPDTEGTHLMDLGAAQTVPWLFGFHSSGPWDALERLFKRQLDSQQATYGILLPRPGNSSPTALVISRHESDADRIKNAMKYCVCRIIKSHKKSCPPASDNADCDWCSGTYKCY